MSLSGQIQRGLRFFYMLLLPGLLLALGSVEPLPLHLMAGLSFLLTALALASIEPSRSSRWIVVLTAGLAILTSSWILIQTIELPLNALANSIWETAARLPGLQSPTISVARSDTRQGLVAVLLPFSVFMSGVLLFQGDEKARNLLRYLALLGAAIAAFGLVQFLLYPGMLLADEKTLYLDSLTAVFVNRNTAATYLGMAMILNAAMAFSHLQNSGAASLVRLLLGARSSTRWQDAALVFFYSLSSLVTFSALLLTRSRAGLAATLLGLTLVVVLLAYHGGQRSRSPEQRGFATARTARLARLLRAGLAAVILLAVALAFSGRTLLRAEIQGAEDGRFCITPGLLRLTADNWLTGTGLGTFRMVFPAYKDPICGLAGTWERAHNFYLDGWIALGLPFVILAAVVIVALVRALVAGTRNRQQYRWAPVAGLGILTLQLVHNLVDFSLQIPAVPAVFASILAACITLSASPAAKGKRPRQASGPPSPSTRPDCNG